MKKAKDIAEQMLNNKKEYQSQTSIGLRNPTQESDYPLVKLDNYKCPTCHDQKFINVQRGHHIRSIPCPDGCNRELSQHRLLMQSGIPQQEQHISFDTNFHPIVAPAATYLYETIMQPYPSGYVFISGSYGCGKTHLLKASVNQAIINGTSAYYATADDILSEVRMTFNDKSVTEKSILRKIELYQVVCIDEIDRISFSDWSKSYLFKILDMRYKQVDYGIGADSRLTVMASNRPLEQLEGYIISRLKDQYSKVFELWNAPDYRQLRAAVND